MYNAAHVATMASDISRRTIDGSRTVLQPHRAEGIYSHMYRGQAQIEEDEVAPYTCYSFPIDMLAQIFECFFGC